jgi:opacity protein-like surface antigen
MKKAIVAIVVFLLCSSFAFAQLPDGMGGEFSTYYPFSTELHQKYFHTGYVGLSWQTPNYALDLNLTPLVDGDPLEIVEAWANFNLYSSEYTTVKSVDLKIGKIEYDFGNVSVKPSENLSILQPRWFGSNFMLKLSGDICHKYQPSIYLVDPGTADYDQGMHLGARLAVKPLENLYLGASVRVLYIISDMDDDQTEYGFDIEYLLMDAVKFNIQAYEYFAGAESWGDDHDWELWALVSYDKGFELPILNKIVPYVGYYLQTDHHESEDRDRMIIGLNLAPTENSFVKLEYNLDSLDKEDVGIGFTDCSDTFCAQIGFRF